MGTRRVGVLVADDHPLYREGLLRAIKEWPELELLGDAEDGETALEEIKRLRPDVAILDMKMPGLEGTQVLNAVARLGIETRVIFLSAHLESELAYKTLAAGASGYLSKEAERREICEAIMSVSRGKTVLDPAVQSGLATEIRQREQVNRLELTGREHEVLSLIAQGYSAPAIGERIHLSPATVKSHLQGLYQKLGVSDRAAAVAEGMRRGLIE